MGSASPGQQELARLDAHEIWGTQESIEPVFTAPPNSNGDQPAALEDVLHQLRVGSLLPCDLPPIRVVWHTERFYSLDNRRLWLFHQLPAPCEVPVVVLPCTKEFFQKRTVWRTDQKTPRVRPSTYASAAAPAGPEGDTTAPVASGPVSSRYSYQGRLEGLVLRWSEVNILNTGYFNAEQLAPIPSSFDSSAQYARAFIWCVAEEVRAQLQQALQGISSSSSWVHIPSLRPRRHLMDDSGDPHDRDLHAVKACISLDSLLSFPGAGSGSGGSSGSSGGRQQLQLPFRPKDLLLLSSKQVSSVEELKQGLQYSPWMLALVTAAPDQQQLSALAAEAWGAPRAVSSSGGAVWASADLEAEVRLTVFAAPGSPEHELLFSGSSSNSWYACSLGSLATGMRTFNALQQLAKLPGPSSLCPILQQVLQASGLPSAADSHNSFLQQAGEQQRRLSAAVTTVCQQSPALNPSQQAVLLQVATSTAAPTTSSSSSSSRSRSPGSAITLVQGPPGSGKSATATRLLSILGCCGHRVLACAPTNVAVCQLADKYLRLLDSNQQFVSACSSTDRTMPGGAPGSYMQPLRRGDVLLVGSEERLDLTEALLGVHLPARVQRLMGVVGPNGLLGTLQQVRHVLSARLLADWQQQQQRQQHMLRGQSGSEPDCAAFGELLLAKVELLLQEVQQQMQVVRGDLPLQQTSSLQQHLQALTDSLQLLATALQQQRGTPSALSAFALLQTRFGPTADFTAAAGSTAASACGAELPAWLPAAVEALHASAAAQAAMPSCFKQRPNAYALQQLCLRSCRHLFCTVAGVGSGVMSAAGSFAVAVVDEAAQLVEAEAAILLARTCCPDAQADSDDEDSPGASGSTGSAGRLLQHLVLVGDPKQLPATVISQRAVQVGYSRSLFERLQQQGHPVLLLDVQYRCRPEISLWPRQRFYEGRLQDGPNVCEPTYGAGLFAALSGSAAGLLQPFLVLDLPGSFEERGSSSGAGSDASSISNPLEADVVMYLLKHCCLPAAKALGKLSVGVISPYRRQVAAIMQQCSGPDNIASTSSSSSSVVMGGMRVDVRSVDGFQGSERDVIILSAVRSNPQHSIGFLSDPRRLNVAVTKARHALIVVCSASTLAADPAWGSLIRSARQRGLLRVLQPGPGDDLLLSRLHARLSQRLWEDRLLRGQAKLFADCPWQVYFSRDCADSLVRLPDGHLRAQVLQQLHRLAKGTWPPQLRPHNAVAAKYQPILQVHYVLDMYLVWMVDVDQSTCTQVIKACALLSREADLLRCLARLQNLLGGYSEECLKLCSKRKQRQAASSGAAAAGQRNRLLTLPAAAAAGSITHWYRGQAQTPAAEPDAGSSTSMDDSDSLMATALGNMKFYLLNAPLAARVCTATSNSQVEALLQLSAEESKAVYHPRSILLAARSGTGKSTVIVHRLVDRELAYQAALEHSPSPPAPYSSQASTSSSSSASAAPLPPRHLPQLLVTRSEKLCAKLANEVGTILAAGSSFTADHMAHQAHTGAAFTAAAADAAAAAERAEGPQLVDSVAGGAVQLGAPLPAAFGDLCDEHFPAMLPMRQLLDMLNAGLPEPFQHGAPKQQGAMLQPTALEDSSSSSSSSSSDDDDDEDSLSWSDAAGYGVSSSAQAGGSSSMWGTGARALQPGLFPHHTASAGTAPRAAAFTRGAEVDFDLFCGQYWPRFNVRLTRGLEPSMVFAEIQGVIKGSEGSLTSPKGRLSRQQYLGLGERRCSNLAEEQRLAVYKIFRRYEALKAERGQYDVLDLTHHVWRGLQEHSLTGPRMQFVYVDEAQDLVMAQLALLTLLCNDPTSGLVVAGDSRPCLLPLPSPSLMCRGVTFRFADVGTLVHHGLLGEEQSSSSGGSSSSSRQAADGPAVAAATGGIPSRTSSDSTPVQQASGGARASQQQPLTRAVSAPAAATAASDGAAGSSVQPPSEPKVPKRAAKLVGSFKGKFKQHAAAALERQAQAVEAAWQPTNSASSSKQGKSVSWGQQPAEHSWSSPDSWAGDQGSSALPDTDAAATAASGSSSGSSSHGPKLPPVMDQISLRRNWRTQAQVLAVANAITEVLYVMFPSTVDKLPAELSSVQGDVPLMLCPGAANDPLLMVFGRSSSSTSGASVSNSTSTGSGRGLGSNMNACTAVLVWDDAAAAAVRQHVRDGALVLTVAEAKGLEFENILAYNLFSCSPAATKRLRLLYTYLAHRGLLSTQQQQQPRYKGPAYEASKHYEFSTDLKCLYVVVTRARSRLLLFEESEEASTALQDFFQLCNSDNSSSSGSSMSASSSSGSSLVAVKPLEPQLLYFLQQESSSDEWRDTGTALFNEAKYERAELCFRRAGDVPNATLCQAEQQVVLARRSQDQQSAAQHYLQAAALFRDVCRWMKAADCLEQAGSFKAAADIYCHSCHPPQLSRAARCYSLAGCWKEAADAFAADGQLDPALKCCLDGKLWDYGLELLDSTQQQQEQAASSSGSSKQQADKRVRYAQACAASLHNLRQKQDMMRFVKLLPDRKQQTFMINRGLLAELAAQLEQTHSWQEVAGMCEAAGDLVKAAQLHAQHGEGAQAAQLLLRQARLLLLWPAAEKLAPGAAREQALQLLLKASQALAEAEHADAAAAAAAEAEMAVLSGLARGFSTSQQVWQWSAEASGAAAACDAMTAAYLQLVVAAEGFAHALWLAANTASGSSAPAGAATLDAASKLWQQWQQLQQVLLPVLKATDTSLRLSQPLSAEQALLLRACERYLCVRPSGSSAGFRTAERGGILWVQGLTSAPERGPGAGTAEGMDAAPGSTDSSVPASGTLQLSTMAMLSRAGVYWQWWLAAQGSALVAYLLQQSKGSQQPGASTQGVQLLLHSWQTTHMLLQQLHRARPVVGNPTAADDARSGSNSIAAALPVLLGTLHQQQQQCLQAVLDLLLCPPYAAAAAPAAAAASRGSTSAAPVSAAAVLHSLLQQQSHQELTDQLAWCLLRGDVGGPCLMPAHYDLATDHQQGRSGAGFGFAGPPPPPQPDGLTYDRIGQLCLLAALLDPDWLKRAAAQRALFLRPPSGCSGLVAWVRLLQAADWLGRARSTDLLNPPQHGAWEHYYPACSYAWRCCIGLRDYVETLGVLPGSLRGGLMPHTFCSLLQTAVVSACAVTTSMHNLLLPQQMAVSSMGGAGMAGLYAWVVLHGATGGEKLQMQKELLRLSRCLGSLLTQPLKGLPAWCETAADVMSFHSSGSSSSSTGGSSGHGGSSSSSKAGLSRAVQEATARQLFWMLLVIATNNRPTVQQLQRCAAVAAGQAPWSRPPLSVEIQQAFIHTLVQLASAANTAMCLLPERLQLTTQKLLARAAASSSRAGGLNPRGLAHSLQFDPVAAELLSAAASCGTPWTTLYLSYTKSEAPAFARLLRTVMVDQQAFQAPGGYAGALSMGVPLFSVEQLLPAPAGGQAAATSSMPPAALSATAASFTLSSTGSFPAGAHSGAAGGGSGQEQQQQPPAAAPPTASSSSRRSRLQQEDEQDGDSDEDEDGTAGSGRQHWALDGDDPLAGLAGAHLVNTWVHWRLRCALARAVARLRKQLTPLERLQQEARAVLGPPAAVTAAGAAGEGQQQQGAVGSGAVPAAVGKAGAAQAYLDLYLKLACPVMVEVSELLQQLEDCSIRLRSGAVAGNRADADVLLDDVCEARDDSHALLAQLEPRSTAHERRQVSWLRGEARKAKEALQQLQRLVRAAHALLGSS